MSVECKAGELFQLGRDPARLLTAIDRIGKRQLVTVLGIEEKRVRGLCAFLLRHRHRQDLRNIGERNFVSCPGPQQAPAVDNFAVTHFDAA
jgi:hypothetical protein